MTRLAIAVATFFGCGYFPKGPGTAGSLAALLLVIAGHSFLGLSRPGLALATLILLPIGIWASTRTSRALNRKDPGLIVVDEVLGQWVTLLGAAVWNWKTYLAALLLFRLFDIWKPQPVRMAEALSEGTGVVADDVIAGLYGALVLYLGSQLRLY
jgi:phosphatidylglycerophosphatase A